MKIRHLLYVALVVGLSAALAPIYGPGLRAYAAPPATAATADDLDKDMKSVASAYALIEKNFADPVTSEKAFYQGAIPGMLHTLDPHSNFVDPDDYREMQRRQRAQYYGVGMEILGADNHVNVMRPFYGSPAYNAGFRRGDVIEAVDGKDVATLDSSAVANLLRGPRGTQVRVTVKREGAPDFITAQVTRGEIETSVIDAFRVTPEVIYLRVNDFEASNLSHDVEAAMRKLGETKAKGLILDLRANPGGLVNEAVALAGRWLKDGQVVVSHHGLHEEEQVFRAKSVATGQKYPIVVLVNSQSASASEIVSGALQDHDRAWLIGETTFGKGLVQAQFPLSEGAALLLTIAHYYTPSGRLISATTRTNPITITSTPAARKRRRPTTSSRPIVAAKSSAVAASRRTRNMPPWPLPRLSAAWVCCRAASIPVPFISLPTLTSPAKSPRCRKDGRLATIPSNSSARS